MRLDINYSDRQGRTVCTLPQSLGIVQRLVEQGAVVNMCDNHGNTPLIGQQMHNIIKFLMMWASLSVHSDGETPANVAIAQANSMFSNILDASSLQSFSIQPTKPVIYVSSTYPDFVGISG